jgi:ATP-dependent Clp protease adapter protein ClpS
MVVIFDNSFNTMDEVITVLMQATNCDFNEAYMEMWEAHHFGKASVHFGSKEVCDEVANVISEVGVETQVTQEWPEN